MGEKEVTECAGIGPTYAKRLEEKGFTKAYQLLAQYLLFTKDEEMFQEWLKVSFNLPRPLHPLFQDEISMKGKHLKDCSTCISEWSRAFM